MLDINKLRSTTQHVIQTNLSREKERKAREEAKASRWLIDARAYGESRCNSAAQNGKSESLFEQIPSDYIYFDMTTAIASTLGPAKILQKELEAQGFIVEIVEGPDEYDDGKAWWIQVKW